MNEKAKHVQHVLDVALREVTLSTPLDRDRIAPVVEDIFGDCDSRDFPYYFRREAIEGSPAQKITLGLPRGWGKTTLLALLGLYYFRAEPNKSFQIVAPTRILTQTCEDAVQRCGLHNAVRMGLPSVRSHATSWDVLLIDDYQYGEAFTDVELRQCLTRNADKVILVGGRPEGIEEIYTCNDHQGWGTFLPWSINLEKGREQEAKQRKHQLLGHRLTSEELEALRTDIEKALRDPDYALAEDWGAR